MENHQLHTATCRHCDVEFTFERLGKRLRQYCSPTCIWLAGRARAGRAKASPTGFSACERCGIEFQWRGFARRFCTSRCRHLAYNASAAGKARGARRTPTRAKVQPGSTSRGLRQRAFDRDGWRCVNCSCPVQTDRPQAVDGAVMRWIISAKLGGSRDLANVRTLCRRCSGRQPPQASPEPPILPATKDGVVDEPSSKLAMGPDAAAGRVFGISPTLMIASEGG